MVGRRVMTIASPPQTPSTGARQLPVASTMAGAHSDAPNRNFSIESRQILLGDVLGACGAPMSSFISVWLHVYMVYRARQTIETVVFGAD